MIYITIYSFHVSTPALRILFTESMTTSIVRGSMARINTIRKLRELELKLSRLCVISCASEPLTMSHYSGCLPVPYTVINAIHGPQRKFRRKQTQTRARFREMELLWTIEIIFAHHQLKLIYGIFLYRNCSRTIAMIYTNWILKCWQCIKFVAVKSC